MRPAARTFQDLIVWQKAHRFILDVYKLTGQFPKSEIFGLALQFRRSAVSIPANIAVRGASRREGFKKKRKGRQSTIYEHCTRFIRKMPILSNSR